MKNKRKKYETLRIASVEMDPSSAILSGSTVDAVILPNEVKVEEMTAGFANSDGVDVGYEVKFD